MKCEGYLLKCELGIRLYWFHQIYARLSSPVSGMLCLVRVSREWNWRLILPQSSNHLWLWVCFSFCPKGSIESRGISFACQSSIRWLLWFRNCWVGSQVYYYAHHLVALLDDFCDSVRQLWSTVKCTSRHDEWRSPIEGLKVFKLFFLTKNKLRDRFDIF